MSYHFQADKLYRMPTHFGPSLGPRQGLNGRNFSCIESPRVTNIQATFEAKTSQLKELLPPQFCVREPCVITFSFDYIRDIEWLAGRSYHTFGVSTPVIFSGQQDFIKGDFLLVTWVNMADSIITGREELGIAKVYCELPEPQYMEDSVICRASWDGCQFAKLELLGLEKMASQSLNTSNLSEGLLHYKYIPKTCTPGIADVEYPVLTPASWPNTKVEHVEVASQSTCQIRPSTWEELPTLVNIVNTLSELTLGECIEASVSRLRGGKDLSDQRILV